MQADLGAVEHELLALRAVVRDDGDAAAHADEELVALAVRVLAAHLGARHVEDEEEALRRERQVAAELADREAPRMSSSAAGDGSGRPATREAVAGRGPGAAPRRPARCGAAST